MPLQFELRGFTVGGPNKWEIIDLETSQKKRWCKINDPVLTSVSASTALSGKNEYLQIVALLANPFAMLRYLFYRSDVLHIEVEAINGRICIQSK